MPEDFYVDSRKSSGRQSKCKQCQKARYDERLALDPVRVRAIGAASQRKHRRRRLYGLSEDEIAERAAAQDGKCAICEQVPPPKAGTTGGLVVDHCHRTQAVRGLLCHNCNRALGLFHDDAETVYRAADYLEHRRWLHVRLNVADG